VYVPDLPKRVYQDLLETLVQEFTHAFGGCTLLRDLDGSYLSRLGMVVTDRINLVYTDVPAAFEDNFERLSRYTDYLREAVAEGLEEEAILVAVLKVHHAQ
jgi:hypothetical protein